MTLTRRDWLQQTALSSLAVPIGASLLAADAAPDALIIDTHQHLWDLQRLKLPWLDGAPAVLKQNYRPEEYREATRGLNVQAVYMEVDVAADNLDVEADYVVGLCRAKSTATVAATIGGRPNSPRFAEYIRRHKASGFVKGVRQVLHVPETPAGFCLKEDFVRGVRALGEAGMHFDLCMRPTELSDGLKLSERCPETRFVLDHCGNADPKAFRPASEEKPWHDATEWKRDIERLAKRPNVIGKISGIVARAPRGWKADDLAPIVNHCLDCFGSDRVVFGGDWPVCLLGAKLGEWITALRQIVASRPATDQRKLWSENAKRFYTL